MLCVSNNNQFQPLSWCFQLKKVAEAIQYSVKIERFIKFPFIHLTIDGV